MATTRNNDLLGGASKPAGGSNSVAAGAAAKSAAGAAKSVAGAPRGERFLADEEAQRAVEDRYPEGMTAAQVVEVFNDRGLHLSEATFRKWVQIGLLPRSRRVGRKGKHQGSLGLYPAAVVRRSAAIRRRMLDGLTIDDIARSLRFREEIEAVERGLAELFKGFAEQLEEQSTAEGDRRRGQKLLEQLRTQSGELVRRIGTLERQIVEPLEREAKARAFATGTSGGAGDLL